MSQSRLDGAAVRVSRKVTPIRPAGQREGLRVGIIGGGIAGLAAAHYVLKAGHTPVVLESSDQLGGLGTHFEHMEVSLDRYYHVVLDSDADLCGLMDEIGIGDRMVWQKTGMGFLVDGALYPFNTPLDLLRFRALSLVDRVRTGFGALYITSLKKHALDLDNVPARDWLLRLFGPRVFERIWDPLLRAKFGELRQGVPAYWVWNTLNREKNGSQEVKGYPRGGYRGVAEVLRDSIAARGGEVQLRSPVASVEPHGSFVALEVGGRRERFDAVVSTLPLPLLARVARGELANAVPLPELRYQGVVNVLLVTRRRLSPFYWTAVVDPTFPFQGIVETTHVIPTEWTGGRHLLYLMNYCGADTETYARPDGLLSRQALDGLKRLYPGFRPDDVEAAYVFRAPHVEPAWTLGYLKRRPAPRVGQSRVYVCTTAQAYPRVTAWNTSVNLARETVDALTHDLAGTASAARAGS
jgi:protoporphyrinogen oxidase